MTTEAGQAPQPTAQPQPAAPSASPPTQPAQPEAGGADSELKRVIADRDAAKAKARAVEAELEGLKAKQSEDAAKASGDWEKVLAARDQRLTETEKGKRESDAKVESLTRDLVRERTLKHVLPSIAEGTSEFMVDAVLSSLEREGKITWSADADPKAVATEILRNVQERAPGILRTATPAGTKAAGFTVGGKPLSELPAGKQAQVAQSGMGNFNPLTMFGGKKG